MNADRVRAIVAAQWPQAMQSPLAVACATLAAADEAARAVAFADLHARADEAEAKHLRADALEHARACLRARDGWSVETLGHNIESSFGFDPDDCDEIARLALGAP